MVRAVPLPQHFACIGLLWGDLYPILIDSMFFYPVKQLSVSSCLSTNLSVPFKDSFFCQLFSTGVHDFSKNVGATSKL